MSGGEEGFLREDALSAVALELSVHAALLLCRTQGLPADSAQHRQSYLEDGHGCGLKTALKCNEKPLTTLKNASVSPSSQFPNLLSAAPLALRSSQAALLFSFLFFLTAHRKSPTSPLRPMCHSIHHLTCMPSCPEIPTPTSATWIMLTSLAPSPVINVGK